MTEMTITELAAKLRGQIINSGEEGRTVRAFYAGDFLSHVMGRAEEDSAWFTVMNNVNVAGVAVLADVSAVVLCEGIQPDDQLRAKAAARSINLIVTDMTVFEACRAVI